jgi:mannose-6-phosphate isomerase-like protein (cupin superfamily)
LHHLVRAQDIKPTPEYPDNSVGLARSSLVDRSAGAVHTALGLCVLAEGGSLDTHLHSFEELFYILEGSPILVLDDHAVELTPGACGVVPVGISHAWRGPRKGGAKWIDMRTPIPRAEGEPPDTFFLGKAPQSAAQPLDIRDPRNRHLFLMSEDDIDVKRLQVGSRVNAPTVSASMATALLAYSGIAVKMLVDQRLDAALATMFMVDYQLGGIAHPHDHPLEEAYFMLEGEVEVVADGATYTLQPGDAFWTGVGSIHAFVSRTATTVRWLETQSPQPPIRHSYRFSRDWDYLSAKLAKDG